MVNAKTGSSHLTLKEIFIVSRPFWWVNTAAGFVASYFIINNKVDLTLAVGTIYFAFIYNLMMYGVNDIYDYESDMLNPRKTGIDGSVMAKSKHPKLWLAIFITNIPFTVYLLAVGDTVSNIWLVFMIFMVWAYSVKGLRFKEVPFLDSVTSSFHYTSPFIYGGLLSGASELYIPAFSIYFVWVAANHAFGAIQDITPDREAGIGSIAAKLGAAPTVVLVLALYAIAAVLPVAIYGLKAVIVSVLLLPYVYIVARTLQDRHNDSSPLFSKGWKQFLYVNYVIGFILTFVLLYGFDVFSR